MANRLFKHFLPFMLMSGACAYDDEYLRHKPVKPTISKAPPKEPTHRDSYYRAWQKEHRKRLRAKRRKARR